MYLQMYIVKGEKSKTFLYLTYLTLKNIKLSTQKPKHQVKDYLFEFAINFIQYPTKIFVSLTREKNLKPLTHLEFTAFIN